MADKVGLGTRFRIFVVSTGLVAGLAGGGALYLAFFHNETSRRVGVLEHTTETQGQQIQTNTGVIESHGKRLDAAEQTLGEHDGRIATTEQAVIENKKAAGEAQTRADAASASAETAVRQAAELEKRLGAVSGKSAAEIAALKQELAALRSKIRALEEHQQAQMAAIIERLGRLEARADGDKP